MKNILLSLSFLLFYISTYAQVGIGTTTPSSTLSVNGSIEGNFKEITASTYTILADDYHVSYSGTVNTTFTLPTITSSASDATDFRGRKYYIKNNSTTADLTFNTAVTTQIIRFGGTRPNIDTFVLKLGNFVTFTASNSGWDLDLVANTTAANKWILYDTDLDGYVNGSAAQNLSAAVGTYTTLVKPNDPATTKPPVSVSVTVPPIAQYATNRVVVNFVGWGDALVNTAGRGSLRFRILENDVSSGTVMMTSWSTPSNSVNGIRYNFPIAYVINNKPGGVYTYKLEVTREDESGTIVNPGIRVWTLQGKAEVYVR